MNAKSHVMMFVNASAAAKDALLDSRDGEQAIPLMVDAQMQAMNTFFEGGYIPDINGLYAFEQLIDGARVMLVCKPRGFRKAIQQAGWGIAILTRDEYAAVEFADPYDRDAAVLERVPANEYDSARWLAVY